MTRRHALNRFSTGFAFASPGFEPGTVSLAGEVMPNV
jgi:hypothetical protein